MKIYLILKALDFAAYKHKYQRRKGDKNLPYINHPIKVAYLLSDIGEIENPLIISSAILHDVVEDTETTFNEIKEIFGDKIESIVRELTDDKTIEKEERKKIQIERAKYLSYEATLIRIADKIANIIDIVDSPPIGWSVERRNAYLNWAENVVKNCKDEDNHIKKLKKYFFEKLNNAKKSLKYNN